MGLFDGFATRMATAQPVLQPDDFQRPQWADPSLVAAPQSRKRGLFGSLGSAMDLSKPNLFTFLMRGTDGLDRARGIQEDRRQQEALAQLSATMDPQLQRLMAVAPQTALARAFPATDYKTVGNSLVQISGPGITKPTEVFAAKDKAPAGYDWNDNGTLSFIPGGPGDPKSAGALADARRAPSVTVNMNDPTMAASIKTAAQQAIISGNYPSMSRPTAASLAIWAEIKKQLEESGDTLGAANANATFRKGVNAALVDNTRQRTKIATFEQYVDKNLDSVLANLKSTAPTNVPLVNLVKNAAAYHLGQGEIVALRNNIQAATSELAAILSGSTSGNTPVTALEEARHLLNDNMTVPQIESALKQIRLEMHNRDEAYSDTEVRLKGQLRAGGVGGLDTPSAHEATSSSSEEVIDVARDPRTGKMAVRK